MGRAQIIEEALNGRTMASDEPLRPNRNGLAMLPPLLEAHAPLDIVVIMLGTNDCAPFYKLTPGQIAMHSAGLIRAVKASFAGPGDGEPKTLLIAPPLLGFLSLYSALFYAGGETVSRGLADAYRVVASSLHCMFLDAAQVVTASRVDGVHLDPPEHLKLALAVKRIVEPLL